jgi:hypothetical protein
MQEELITKETAVLGESIGYPFYTYPNVPTQSLLQKWLREVHNIFITVNINLYCAIFHNKDFYMVTDYYNSYEEVLEVGLQEALKLIEIVKEK